MAIYEINPSIPVDPTSLGRANYTATSILNTIYNTVNSMVSSLQNVTAAETGRINLMTDWQAAYTSKMNQLHTFTQNESLHKSDGTALNYGPLYGTSSSAANLRASLNNLNTRYLQNLQNRQTVLSNQSKALQSSIDQSNSAVNTQSTQGTSIIQTLATLLGSTFA